MNLQRGPEIGQGSFGTVYATDKSWVVKVPKRGHEESLRKEALIITALLPHKNIVAGQTLTNVKVGTEMQSIVLYMPHCGPSLYDILRRRNPPFKRTAAILEDFLHQSSAISKHLQTCSIIHGDIAPRNILFNGEIFTLIDYGLAKHYGKKTVDVNLYEYYDEVIRWYRVYENLRAYVEMPQCIKVRRIFKEQVEDDDEKLYEAMQEMWSKPEIVSCDVSCLSYTPRMNVLVSNLDNVKEGSEVRVDVVNVTEDGNLLVQIDNEEYVFEVDRQTPPVAKFDIIAQQNATQHAVLTCVKKEKVLGRVTSLERATKRMCRKLHP